MSLMEDKRSMIIVDNKIPKESKEKLSDYGEVIGLYTEGNKVRNYPESLTYEIVELFNGPLMDAGGILFI